jgi:hypothetical protein
MHCAKMLSFYALCRDVLATAYFAGMYELIGIAPKRKNY